MPAKVLRHGQTGSFSNGSEKRSARLTADNADDADRSSAQVISLDLRHLRHPRLTMLVKT